MVEKYSFSSVKLDNLASNNQPPLIKNSEDVYQKFVNTKTVDITSRLGQFAWRQITSSTILIPVIFRYFIFIYSSPTATRKLPNVHDSRVLTRSTDTTNLNSAAMEGRSLTICIRIYRSDECAFYFEFFTG